MKDRHRLAGLFSMSFAAKGLKVWVLKDRSVSSGPSAWSIQGLPFLTIGFGAAVAKLEL